MAYGPGTTTQFQGGPPSQASAPDWFAQQPQPPAAAVSASTPPAASGAPPTGGAFNAGGGWDDPNLSPAAKALHTAFSQGLTGQAAVDAANTAAGLQPPNSISFGDGGYGLPGGQYVAPNAAKGGQLDLITRGGGGGGGGGSFGGPGASGQYGSLTSAPGTFEAPSGLTEANDPGFMARMKMGTDAIQSSAAAKGSVLSGGTLKALDRYAQDYGSNEYGNIYNRAAQGYQINTGTQRNAQNDYWTRLQSLYAAPGTQPAPA